MADPNINIGIKTIGADAAVSDLNKVKGASDSVTKGQLAPGNSLGPRDDAGRERALRDVQALTDKAKVAEIAFYDLGAKINLVDKPLEKIGATATETHGKLSKTGYIVNQASMQVGDFAQQVTGGTSALRAFSQQAPQLIGTFTSMGLVTGGVGMALMGVAVALPIVTAAGSAFVDWMDAGSTKAMKLSEDVGDLGGEIAKIQTNHLDKFKEDLETSKAIAKNLKTDMSGLRQAESESAQAIITNAGKMAAAEEKINVILGVRFDQFRQIKEANDLARAQREKDLADAQKQAADDRKKKADELATLKKELEETKAAYTKEQEAMKRRQDRIGPMQENRAKQEKAMTEDKPGFFDYVSDPVYAIAAQEKTDVAESEYKRLDNTLAGEHKGAEANKKALDQMANSIKVLESDINGRVKQMATDSQAAEISLDTLVKTQETSKVVELADTAQKYQEKVTATAQKLKTDLEAAAAIQGSLSPQNASALAIITKQLENGVIDPNELQQFSTVMSLVKSSREAVKNQILGSYAEVLASDREIREAMKAMQLQYQEMMRR